MDLQNIHKLIEQGEGISVEFKRGKNELPSNLFETICAFLNRNGGHILIGVNDNKTLEGINPEKAETFCKNITNLSNNPQKLAPSFLLTATQFELHDKTLLHIYVPISSVYNLIK